MIFVKAEGCGNASELAAMVLEAIADARAGAETDESGHVTPPPVEREATSSESFGNGHAAGGGGGATSLPGKLRRLGRCLLLIDHLELRAAAGFGGGGNGGVGGGAGSGASVGAGSGGGGGDGGVMQLLLDVLQRAPELNLFITSTEPVALPGVASRQVVLGPMPPKDAGRLFKALAPRPISRSEVGCDDPRELKAELTRLIGELAHEIPQLENFEVRPPPPAEPGRSPGRPPVPLRVAWRLPSLAAAAALHRELSAQSTLLQLDTPPISASGTAALVGFLSLPKMLARHPALTSLHGNPKAISLAVSLLQPGLGATSRPLGEVGIILERHGMGGGADGSGDGGSFSSRDGGSFGGGGGGYGGGGGGGELTDGCRQVLDQLGQILYPDRAAHSPGTPGRGDPPPSTPPRGNGSPRGVLASESPSTPAEAFAEGYADDVTLNAPGGDEAGGGGRVGRYAEDPLSTTQQLLQDLSVEPNMRAAQRAGSRLHPSLRLKKEEFDGMFALPHRFIGSGQIGAVYDVDYNGTRCACKKFFESVCSSKAFERETVLLADLRHPNIVQLIKVRIHAPLSIVTELLVCSLHGLLHGKQGGEALQALMLTPGMQQLKTAVHIARGMTYLHTLEPPVLHRNLKSHNLLVDEAGKVKIADFGWSKLKSFDPAKTFYHGWQWVAPEILWGGAFTEAADVYSFSMVCWEVFAQEMPFKGLNPLQIGHAVGTEKVRPPAPPNAPDGLGDLLENCWHNEPKQRFTFPKILGRLNALVAMSSAEGLNTDRTTEGTAHAADSTQSM